MQLSTQELFFLNKMLDGKPIFGISGIQESGNSMTSLSDIGRSLMEKQIFLNECILSQEGGKLLEMLRQYKLADTYVVLNHVNIALLRNDYVVNLYQESDEYNLTRLTKGDFLFGILKEFSIMRRADFDRYPKRQQMTYRMWKEQEQAMEGAFSDSVFHRKFYNGRMTEARVYYWNDEEMYRYDILRKEYRFCNGSEMRQSIFTSIENVRKGV